MKLWPLSIGALPHALTRHSSVGATKGIVKALDLCTIMGDFSHPCVPMNSFRLPQVRTKSVLLGQKRETRVSWCGVEKSAFLRAWSMPNAGIACFYPLERPTPDSLFD